MTKPWHSKTLYVPAPQSRQPVTKNGFTKAAARRMAMYDNRKPGANFKCPRCHVYFYLTYGVLGYFKTFEQPSFHCRDCSKISGFNKVK